MIVVETFKGKSVTDHSVEIVERKGTGHPDYMCDSIMDAISVALSKEYIKEFGTVLHHNIDKGLLAAGKIERKFGGGRVLKPMELIIGDRATFMAAGKEVPVADIAIDAAKKWIKKNLRFVDPERHLRYRVVLAQGSEELTDIFLRPGKVRPANDTSAAVGYYPLSPVERVVLELEKYLNSKKFKHKYPETGEDIKVMGLRRGNALSLTVAMPFIARYIESEQDYFERKALVQEDMTRFVKGFEGFKDIDVYFNTLDEKGRGLGGIYLSLLGTSAEDADSGQVGRGNRVNGLISMNRPMGTEAAAGKNPVSHVGKIYNVMAHRIAKEIYERIEGVKEVYVLLLSMIGTPIDRPQMATAQVLLERGRKINEIAKLAEEIFEQELSGINKFCMDLSKGKYPIC
ncbi:S-adenosylmethionine synthetase [Dissulfurispira thermophila]|uniref:S-adenosylmethionine synthetase n=2 Tax=root TaxID=1 RepID=A0A7G1H4C3_9BACT|nr:methionine adenosyltransferase [Dissulfurispira thermophila]BCB96973.1 S-adenosylmethionine synthetase [Dissulfurispira thermophila]